MKLVVQPFRCQEVIKEDHEYLTLKLLHHMVKCDSYNYAVIETTEDEKSKGKVYFHDAL